MKTPVVVNDDYTLYIEHHAGVQFIHCDCHRWSKTVKLRMIDDLKKMDDLYAIHEIGDKKHAKFLGLLEFEFFKDFMGLDNKPHQIFVRRA